MTIAAIQGVVSELPTTKSGAVQSSPSTSFSQWLDSEMAQTNHNLAEANQAAKQLALGQADNLHQVMIALDKAQVSFELMVQVRNRLVEGIQEVMRMSV